MLFALNDNVIMQSQQITKLYLISIAKFVLIKLLFMLKYPKWKTCVKFDFIFIRASWKQAHKRLFFLAYSDSEWWLLHKKNR